MMMEEKTPLYYTVRNLMNAMDRAGKLGSNYEMKESFYGLTAEEEKERANAWETVHKCGEILNALKEADPTVTDIMYSIK